MNGHSSRPARNQPATRQQQAIQAAVGTFCLLLFAGLVCIIFADATATLPFRMPRSWYVARPLWYVLTFGLFAAAYVLLRNRQDVPEVWQPAELGRRFTIVRVYSREGCLLCDEATEALSAYRMWIPLPEVIDIAGDPDLEAEFGESIPVVEIDGRIRFRGRVDEWHLRRLIDATPPLKKASAEQTGQRDTLSA